MKKLISLFLCLMLIFLTASALNISAEESTYEVGDIISFGSYPQSEITDEEIVYLLNSLAPEWDEWISYGYYSGTGDQGSMMQGDWMRYTDIECNGEKYRGVKFTQYRPAKTCDTSDYTYQDDNGYTTDTAYWFKFEDIKWRIINPTTGLVICENIIDSQPFCNTVYFNSNASIYTDLYSSFNDADYTTYAYDYDTSSINHWLNNFFYNIAFNGEEKSNIEAVDSDRKNTVSLLSYYDASNFSYGFNSDSWANDVNRLAYGSEYSKIQGLRIFEDVSSSSWLLRTEGDYSNSCRGVSKDGIAESYIAVDNSFCGIRPVLNLKFISDKDDSVSEPTVESTTDESSTELDEAPTEPEVSTTNEPSASPDTPLENPDNNCSCNCHKTGIMRLIWKIICFLYRIFNINSICDCGIAHY